MLLLVGTAGAVAQQPGPVVAQGQGASGSAWISGDNAVRPLGLPAIGKWMLAADGTPAHWLGEVYQGKRLREPINVIIVDEGAASAEDAKKRLIATAGEAGYAVRLGHSSGYQGYVGDQLYGQIPSGWDDAFSNEPFAFSNNHGRIFGPHKTVNSYVFVGAFSREEVVPFRWPGHRYTSFNQARDDFARRLSQVSQFKPGGFVNLENALTADGEVTTGDHDGMAVLIRAQ
jgi:hypothetical protein